MPGSYNAKAYLSYYKNMSAVAKANGIKELYFIQPTPAFKESLTSDEKLAAQDLSYKSLYQVMVSDRMALNSQKIPVVSLTDIFKNTPERVFIDRVHLNDFGRKILEEQMLLNLEKHWQIRKK